jgi:hypothetical protein
MRKPFAIAFLVGGCAYLVLLIGCLGSSAGTALSEACSAIGPILRIPFLYVIPYAHSRYFGVDAAVLAVAGNTIVWGIALGILVLGIRKAQRAPRSTV